MGGVSFKVWAPAAESVEIELVDSGTRVPLARDRDGVWTGFSADAQPGSRYSYRLNGGDARPDPYSRSQPAGVHGPSAVVDPGAFQWHDQAWRGVGIQGLVIYQLHVGTFSAEGTFDALIEHLPRLAALGVNAIEPLPIDEFPGERNWGYDGVDRFAPSHVYGGPGGLKRFIDAAHAIGLGVILDVVYNHLGPDGNYLRDFSLDYFTDRYRTPWGDAINYDGRDSEWVRRLVVDNAQYWLHEFHADGLRLDATDAIVDRSPTHVLAELTRAVRASLPDDRQVALIAETSENDVRYLKPVEDGGFGFDAVWADDFHHALRRYLAGDHEGYFARYAGTLEEVARCIEQGWLRGTSAQGQPAWQFVYVVQNHDQVGNRAMGDRLNQHIDAQRFRAASTLLLFLPYTPMLFMGQEFGATTPFQYFTDHNPELGRLVTEGRRTEFAAFSAFAGAATREQIPDPQAEWTFLQSKLRWSESGSELEGLYRQMIALRRTDPVLADQARERMEPRVLTPDVLAVRRWRDRVERLLLVNFGEVPTRVDDFGGGWRSLLDSGAPTIQTSSSGVTVAARSATVLGRGDT